MPGTRDAPHERVAVVPPAPRVRPRERHERDGAVLSLRELRVTVTPSASGNEREGGGERAPRAGLVVAGGYSTRFGEREKALAELDGRPLLAHAVSGLAPAVDGVVVNCRRDQVPAFRPTLRSAPVGVAVAPDPVPDRGPAAGLATGLAAVATDYVALAAADAPFVDPAFVDRLFELAAGRDGAVPRVDGHLQPAHAVYCTRPARRAAREVLATGPASLRGVVDRLDAVVVPEEEVLSLTRRRTFTDVNTVADLRAARREVDDGEGDG